VRRTATAYFNIQSVLEEKEAVYLYMQKRLNWSFELSNKFKFDLDKEIEYLTNIKNG